MGYTDCHTSDVVASPFSSMAGIVALNACARSGVALWAAGSRMKSN